MFSPNFTQICRSTATFRPPNASPRYKWYGQNKPNTARLGGYFPHWLLLCSRWLALVFGVGWRATDTPECRANSFISGSRVRVSACVCVCRWRFLRRAGCFVISQPAEKASVERRAHVCDGQTCAKRHGDILRSPWTRRPHRARRVCRCELVGKHSRASMRLHYRSIPINTGGTQQYHESSDNSSWYFIDCIWLVWATSRISFDEIVDFGLFSF